MKAINWTDIKFSEKNMSNFRLPCPNCQNLTLRVDTDKLQIKETASSIENKKYDFWTYEFLGYNFVGFLICDRCNEAVSMCGNAIIDQDYYFDQQTNQHYKKYYKIFIPKHLSPTPHIFNIPKKCPDELRDEIIASFKLFWFDLSSCANKIRSSIEIFLNLNKINKTTLKNGRRKRISLHQRISLFKCKNEKISKYLLAIKWIGNSGSHAGNLNKKDIIDAYELLEYSLYQHYIKKQSKLDKVSNEINKRKGARKHKS